MWLIIKEESVYHRKIIIAAVVMLLIFLIIIAAGVKPYNQIPAQLIVLVAATFFAVFICEKQRTLHHTERLHLTLPLSVVKLAGARILFPFILWFIITLIYISWINIIGYLSPSSNEIISVNRFLFFNGYILILNAVYMLSRDLSFIISSNIVKIFLELIKNLLVFAAMIPFYIMINIFDLFGENSKIEIIILNWSDSIKNVFAINITGIILISLCWFVFEKRKSFVN